MNNWITVFLFGLLFLQCGGREPIKPKVGSLPFLVYFQSRYRGICVGTLVSRVAILTAAVCVINPNSEVQDTRPINVVVGTTYRHPRRGVRIQVVKIVIPILSELPKRAYDIQRGVAILLLKNSIPDISAEVPLRPGPIDFTGENTLTLQEECIIIGWHFFFKGDTIYPVHKFLLQRNLRSQFMNVAKKTVWCEALILKLRKSLSNLGFHGMIDSDESICIRDPDRRAQPCHGMYGAPYVCNGQVVAMMTAPDAQWTNCTGYSNIITLLSSKFLKDFFACVSPIFYPEFDVIWHDIKMSLYYDEFYKSYDYVPAIYDKLLTNPDGASSTEDEGEDELMVSNE